MYYFYVLQFRKNRKLYKGLTNDLDRRMSEHRRGDSDFTSRNGEFDLIFYEAYLNKKDAEVAEKYFKSGHGREVLAGKLKNYLGAPHRRTGGVA
ncbi:MAG: GIY-YIG nuclease superfamily protein [Parcubacteria group bacterium GW2011_GWA1_48_11b]|uniref:GIY-YIG nuclease superfamily protein n=1 Tax=Candidatus Giovannonibacteria bacterium GW2011_GWB1_47_6b TaxID=1618655 RepID=A0A0G1T5K9_9BACT|nr:MAG: GIY-YIG nuclease superfamily protein [Candidatus Giovannonibacteria bacterium GW2011_GWB1_47_6b]KKU94760.1 MAG: GIY-YIG nuclease superfamily protein [Parcubacteria group bacterium GW2011_GWA1_48_11b]